MTLELDPFDVRRSVRAAGPLAEFNAAGVNAAADVHVAVRLAGLAGESDEAVLLACALAVRAPRIGHVLVDLATIRETATVDTDQPVDVGALPWPGGDWVARCAASPLVAEGDDDDAVKRPLRLVGTSLYLDRYWREERQVAADLLVLGRRPAEGVDEDVLRAGLTRVFPDGGETRQAAATSAAVRRRLAVVAGGPGTGKTTTVARIVALLCEQAAAAGGPPPLVALAAPTGKAAARLEEAVHEEAARLDVGDPVRRRLLDLGASTIHRLLGRRPWSNSRFRHGRDQRLPHDVVIVDETSMVSLSLMARLVAAIRPDARLILVGDPAQLASIEAGAVLGDIVGPAADDPAAAGPIAAGITVLDKVHRYRRDSGIGRLAEAIRAGDAERTMAVLASQPDDVLWIPVEVADAAADPALAPVRDGAVAAARAVFDAAAAGDGHAALTALGAFRLLCAHRRGPDGVATWTTQIETWLTAGVPGFTTDERFYVGRPLLVTENDYETGLYNGDTGVVVAGPDRPAAAFERRGELVHLSPTRLSAIDTVYAMTIHKSQGSQFGTAAVLLPDPASRILTRELLYTAATRARRRLILAATEATIRAAVERPVARASGLRARLWNDRHAASASGGG